MFGLLAVMTGDHDGTGKTQRRFGILNLNDRSLGGFEILFIEMQVVFFLPSPPPRWEYLTWNKSNWIAPSVNRKSFLDCCKAFILFKILSSPKFLERVNSNQMSESKDGCRMLTRT
jgi:hypothetical protein